MSNENSLKNKTVLITGGTRGIGFGIAEHLLTCGCKVAITGRKSDTAKGAAKKLEDKTESPVLAIEADVRSMADMKDAVRRTVEEFGKLDVLVANAGVGHYASIDELSADQWNQTIDTNLTGIFNSVKPAIPHLKDSKGYVITIASLAGTNFFPNGSAYNASKFGVVGFTQSIMLDLRQYDIKVTTIMPGSVASYFNENVPGESDDWKIQPEDLGEMIEGLLKMHPRTLPSKIEVRPLKPPKK